MNSTNWNAKPQDMKSTEKSSNPTANDLQKNTAASGLTARYGCVIMASGIGKRFGSNKLLADFHGRPLISYILEASDTPLFARRIVVTRHEEVAQLCEQLGIECLLHQFPGQNDTIRLGLEALLTCHEALPDSDNAICSQITDLYSAPMSKNVRSQATENSSDSEAISVIRQWTEASPESHFPRYAGCCFCTSDQPFLSRNSIERLIRTADAHPDMICRCASCGQPGNPVMFPSEFFPELMRLPYDKGGGWLIRRYPGRVVPIEVQSCLELEDIDTAADLERIRQI